VPYTDAEREIEEAIGLPFAEAGALIERDPQEWARRYAESASFFERIDCAVRKDSERAN
jgi:hypothetical protein